jgi:hypothetical protein
MLNQWHRLKLQWIQWDNISFITISSSEPSNSIQTATMQNRDDSNKIFQIASVHAMDTLFKIPLGALVVYWHC